ncbi:NAD(P)-dependent alcohol dehydrogenase [Alloacidobacterium dinghuense]|uniref:NAD(P)-dependent alcohol dehydrogenase n=1 Tax=Alloacidobacterium dinghuense TaxID=2763107 RepID=A0A7G8BIY7_9BACT|nr:NAD(P)-dependent alcohol dehydrogenase [Alloacidobacterium dinghuense]QNI32507.1 NAD(P)-dependent alcohol dehydrogenase [Alloacidobacterium dinghuense]
MRLWRIPAFGIDKLELIEAPQPKPGAGEVLVKVRAVSLNYRDLMVTLGHYNPKMSLPRVPVSDGAGEVVAIGEGVTTVKTGQRVAAIFMQNWLDGAPTAQKQKRALGGDVDGMLSEYVVLHENGVVPVPDHLTWEEGATLPCAGVTAWNAVVNAGRVKAGDVVVIQGTGGVSIFALQFAKALGARVLGTSSSDEKLHRAEKFGLDAGVNYKHTSDWAKWVLDKTNGEGADLVVEVGGAGTFTPSLKAVRIGGTVAQIGVLSQTSEAVNVVPILHKQVHVQGIYVGSRAHFLEMNRAIEQMKLKPIVDEVFSFDQAPEALRRMESATHFGKLVIRVA